MPTKAWVSCVALSFLLVSGSGLALCADPPSKAAFRGFEASSLAPVSTQAGDWGVMIVVLNVGQADAILLLTPNGDCCLIDSGKSKSSGDKIANSLLSGAVNHVGQIKTIDLLYTTHYDSDHIGGLPQVAARGIDIRKAYDQGLSAQRHGKTKYMAYAKAIGYPNDNARQDADEADFVRHKLYYGRKEHLGNQDDVEILCVSVRGNTKGTANDQDLDPADKPDTFNFWKRYKNRIFQASICLRCKRRIQTRQIAFFILRSLSKEDVYAPIYQHGKAISSFYSSAHVESNYNTDIHILHCLMYSG